MQFKYQNAFFSNNSVEHEYSSFLFNPQIGPYQVLQPETEWGLETMGNNGILRFPQSSSITRTSPSDWLYKILIWNSYPFSREFGDIYSSWRLGKENEGTIELKQKKIKEGK